MARVADPRKEQRIFMRRSYTMYRHMEKRVGKLPFDLVMFRRLIEQSLGKPCFFCGIGLRAKTISADHRTPMSRGGKKSVHNLAIICHPCNRAKNDLTWDEFSGLMAYLKEMEQAARSSILRRLKQKPLWVRKEKAVK